MVDYDKKGSQQGSKEIYKKKPQPLNRAEPPVLKSNMFVIINVTEACPGLWVTSHRRVKNHSKNVSLLTVREKGGKKGEEPSAELKKKRAEIKRHTVT